MTGSTDNDLTPSSKQNGLKMHRARTHFFYFENLHLQIFRHAEELFPLLLKALSDPSDEVVLLDLEILAEISSSTAGNGALLRKADSNNLPDGVQKALESSHGMNKFFPKVLISLLKLFSTDKQLLEGRGSFIIR